MHILERVNLYIESIKKTPYVYTIQRLGIETFINYIESNGLNVDESKFSAGMMNKLLLYWIPKNKKYLSEVQAYQVVYTIQDIYNYIIENRAKREEELRSELETPTILEIYGKEYMRVYKVRKQLSQLTKDPIIAVDPIVVDLNKYRNRKKRYSDIATTYEQGVFQVESCKEGGQVVLVKPLRNKQYKLLLEYPIYKNLKKGDIIHATIKRKLFYVYWEIEEIKSYYLPEALVFL